jgi:hypothetical protein
MKKRSGPASRLGLRSRVGGAVPHWSERKPGWPVDVQTLERVNKPDAQEIRGQSAPCSLCLSAGLAGYIGEGSQKKEKSDSLKQLG